MTITALDIARRMIGSKEVPGVASSYLVMTMLRLDTTWPQDDSVPWCSAFINFVCWLLGLPRSKSLAARSWLAIGEIVPSIAGARPGFDVVVLTRNGGGHVGFYVGHDAATVQLCGGNQHDAVTVANFPLTSLLGIRRLDRPEPVPTPEKPRPV